jgi:endonuclease/exonuclease/phosphatase (EEP) superfamily protein YafD
MAGRNEERIHRHRRGGCVPALLTVLALLSVAAVAIIERYPGEDSWVGALLVYAPQIQWLVPPAIALLVTLGARRWELVALNFLVTTCTLFTPAGFEVNNYAAPEAGQPVVRVVTWNVYGRTEDVELVRTRLLSWDADIVCLQEARREIFADLLPGYESARAGDLRVFVRGRITHHEAILSNRDPRRYNLLVEAQTQSGAVSVLAVHLPRSPRARSVPRQLEPLADYVRASVAQREREFGIIHELLPPDGPLIVAGDMNTPPTSRYWRSLRAELTDAFDERGRGFGYTYAWRQKLALLRIDYIWTGGGAEPLRCWTAAAAPSDHHPVLAEIALPPP